MVIFYDGGGKNSILLGLSRDKSTRPAPSRAGPPVNSFPSAHEMTFTLGVPLASNQHGANADRRQGKMKRRSGDQLPLVSSYRNREMTRGWREREETVGEG